MLLIKYPTSCAAEITYVIDVVFGSFLELNYNLEPSDSNFFRLELDGRSLSLNASFFSSLELSPGVNLTPVGTEIWDSRKSGWNLKLTDYKVPVLFGEPVIIEEGHYIHIGIDILGSVFFMLSRYEEIFQPGSDSHSRFPAKSSLSMRSGFLDRPIVDEYIEVLWTAMSQLWPGLIRRHRLGEVRVTCDVDFPFDRGSESIGRLVRSCGGDFLKRRNNYLAYSRIRNYISRKKGDYQYDPFYTFDWYMSVCEKQGRRVAFYFIPDKPAGAIDGFYNIDDPEILDLLMKIHKRGHELGVHSSYSSYQSEKRINFERGKMLATCVLAGLDVKILGNRQHFLRWDSTQTQDHLDKAGYIYDTSGSFADMPGFRYGTSWPFKMWSWRKKSSLSIIQRPLILMESSLIADRYMGLGYGDEALAIAQQLKFRALMYGGDFTLLWHNSHFTSQKDRQFFKELIL